MSEEKEEYIYFVYTRVPSSTLSRKSGAPDLSRKIQVSREAWRQDWLNYWTSVQNRRARDNKSESNEE